MIIPFVSLLSNTCNIPYDQILLVLCFLSSIILSIFFRFIKSGKACLLFSLISGISIQYILYEHRLLDAIVVDIIVLLIIKIFPRRKVGIIINIFVFGYLFYLHIERILYVYGEWKLDVSNLFMIACLKWTAFGYNYQDGNINDNIPNNSLNPNNDSRSYSSANDLSVENEKITSKHEDEKDKLAVADFTLLEFFSFIHALPTCLIGPFSEYNDYINFCYKRNNYSDIVYQGSVIRKKVILLIVSTVSYVIAVPYMKAFFFLEKFNLVIQDNNSLPILSYLTVIVLWYSIAFLFKLKYITGFLFSEICCDIAGLSYSQSERNTEKNNDKVLQCKAIECNLTSSIKIFFKTWNISIHAFLKNYCFKRVVKSIGKLNSEIVTFCYSCIWHGFYLSYYVIFGIIILSKIPQNNVYLLEKKYSDWKNNGNRKSAYSLIISICFYLLICSYYLAFYSTFSFYGICLELLKNEDLISFIKQTYYFPLVLAAINVLLAFICGCFIKKTKTQKESNTNTKEDINKLVKGKTE